MKRKEKKRKENEDSFKFFVVVEFSHLFPELLLLNV